MKHHFTKAGLMCMKDFDSAMLSGCTKQIKEHPPNHIGKVEEPGECWVPKDLCYTILIECLGTEFQGAAAEGTPVCAMNQQQEANMPVMGMLQGVTVVQAWMVKFSLIYTVIKSNPEGRKQIPYQTLTKISVGSSTLKKKTYLWMTYCIISISLRDSGPPISDGGCCCRTVAKASFTPCCVHWN